MASHISLSEPLDVYCLPRLQIDWSAKQGMTSLPMVKMTLSFLSPFHKERLLDLSGLNFIFAQVISSPSLFRGLEMHGAVCSR